MKQPSDTQSQSLVISDVTVIDGTGAAPRPVSAVHIEDGRIAAIGRNLPELDGAARLDGRLKYLIPGLWETQAHVCESAGVLRPAWYAVPHDGMDRITGNLSTYLRYGVTTVVDLGGRTDVLVRARSDQHDRRFIGSRLLLSGAHFNWPGGAFLSPWMNRLVGNIADARREVDRAVLEEQLNILKIVYSHGAPSSSAPKMSPEVLKAIVSRGHHHGIPSAAHVDSADDIIEALDAGVDSPEHMFQPVGDWRGARARVIEACLRANAFWPLTITAFETMSHARDVDWLRRRAGQVSDAELHEAECHPESLWFNLPDSDRERAKERFEAAMETAFEAFKSGVRMTMSTDSGISAIFHGLSTHREMELHSIAGIPNLDVITMATRNAAEKLRVDDSLGTIEVGKVADLVLLTADPLESISNTLEIETVIQAGRICADG